jgi:hypothetical protein
LSLRSLDTNSWISCAADVLINGFSMIGSGWLLLPLY